MVPFTPFRATKLTALLTNIPPCLQVGCIGGETAFLRTWNTQSDISELVFFLNLYSQTDNPYHSMYLKINKVIGTIVKLKHFIPLETRQNVHQSVLSPELSQL